VLFRSLPLDAHQHIGDRPASRASASISRGSN
jgi:hypothetical protein